MRNKGYTLIEIAIVLTVIGLIIAGAAYGAHLVRTAKLQAIIVEMREHSQAISNFEQQYGGKPGDLVPDIARRNFDEAIVAATSPTTGNNFIDDEEEKNVAWLQLHAAGFFDQQLEEATVSSWTDTSVTPPVTYTNKSRVRVGQHRPQSSYGGGAGWALLPRVDMPTGSTMLNVLRIGWGEDGDMTGGALTVTEHKYIDAKIDSPDTPETGEYFVTDVVIYPNFNGQRNCTQIVNGVARYDDAAAFCTGNYAEEERR